MKPPGDERTAPQGTSAPDGEDEDFLARWSRRKQLARTASSEEGGEQTAGPRPDPADTATPGDGESAGEVVVDEAARQHDTDGDGSGIGDDSEPAQATAGPDLPPELPSIDSLDENSDYSAFLTPGVAVSLQRRALRKLFQSPKFNIRDGLDDYDLDFSNPEPLGDIVTADMRHRLLQELERLADAGDNETLQADEPAVAAAGTTTGPLDTARATAADTDTAAEAAAEAAADDITGDEDTNDDMAHDDDQPRPV